MKLNGSSALLALGGILILSLLTLLPPGCSSTDVPVDSGEEPIDEDGAVLDGEEHSQDDSGVSTEEGEDISDDDAGAGDELVDGDTDVPDGDESTEVEAGDGDGTAQAICPICEPECGESLCGQDQCGGICGQVCPMWTDCLPPLGCTSYEDPDCSSILCGTDPEFGLVCGYCPFEWICEERIRCVAPAPDCAGIPEVGLCSNGSRVFCQGGTPASAWCPFGACTVDPATQEAECRPVPCLPNCAGRTCGPDGCGGNCGGCPAGERCDDAAGVCLPEGEGCGGIPPQGVCLGHLAAFCEAGTIRTQPCLAEGRGCVQGSGGAACCPVVSGVVPCRGVATHGHCEGEFFFGCEDGWLVLRRCADLGYPTCRRVSMEGFGCYPSLYRDPASCFP